MRKTLLATLAVAVLLGASSVGSAQTSKTLVTVAFAGYDKVLGDIDYLAGLAGSPEASKGLKQMLSAMTQNKGLEGLDTTKPWGAVVQAQGEQFPMCAFVPVTDLKKLLDVLKNFEITAKDAGDGVYELETPVRPVYVKQKGGWAFIGPSPDALKDVPADPLAALGGLEKKYDLAVRASIKNIPEPLRQMFMAQMQMGAQMGMPRMPGEGDEEYAIRSNVAKQALQQITSMVNDLDEVLVGLGVDKTTGATYLDIEMTAVPGTKTAADFATAAQAKTNFAGFNLPGAAVTASVAGTLSDSDVAQLKSYVATIRDKAIKDLKEQGLSDEEQKLAAQILTDVLDVVQKTIDNKKSDAAVALLLKPSSATFVAGGLVAEGAKLEKVVKQLIDLVGKDQPELAKMVKLDAETHQGVRFHTAAIPVPSPEPVKVFGETLEIVLGMSDQSMYLAVGRDAAKTLKEAIDKSKAEPNKAAAPFRISVAATPIAKFAASVTDGPPQQIATMIATMLEQAAGKDHLSITTKAIPNGASTRIEVEQGLLKVLWLAIMQFRGPGGEMAPALP